MAAGGASIFGPGVTITLSNAPDGIEITTNLLLYSVNSPPTITCSGPGRIFHVHTNVTLTLRNMVLTGGSSTNGGAIFNEGTLILHNCVFAANSATNASGAAGANASARGNDAGKPGQNGAGASGGAILSRGALLVYDSVFSNNTVNAGSGGNGGNGIAEFVFSGNGGNGGSGGSAGGGAIFCEGGTNRFFATEFVGNTCTAGSGGAGGTPGSGSFAGKAGSDGTGGVGQGGALLVSGPLSVTNCLFTGNSISGGGGGGGQSGGGAALGGGLDLAKSTNAAYIENTVFFQNTCQGGAGGGVSRGGGLASAAALAQLRYCTFSLNSLPSATATGTNSTAGASSGWDVDRVAGTLKMGCSLLFGGASTNTTYGTNITTVTNIASYTTNITTNVLNIITNISTNFAFTYQTNITTNILTAATPSGSGSLTDLGYNICSDASVAFTVSTSHKNKDPQLDTALSASPGTNAVGLRGGSTMPTLALLQGSPAIGQIPGIPGISFPVTDQADQPRSTPASIGAFEANPISTDVLVEFISEPPTNQSAALGSTLQFNVETTNLLESFDNYTSTATNTTTNFGYQWQFNGTNLSDGGNVSGALTKALKLARLAATNAGSYTVLVGSSTLTGVTTSAVAVLTVLAPVHISVQPKSLSLPAGSTATLDVTATGGPAPAYQWLKNNTNRLSDSPGKISGSTSNVLTINLVTSNDAATYSVLVTNSYGPATSAPAVLTVKPDSTPPTVKIVSPAANARTNAPALNGTAANNVLVTQVSFWLTNLYTGSNTNGTATLTPASGALVAWSIGPALSPGTNILTVQSRDFSGNLSAKVSCAFFCQAQAALSLNKGGAGNGTFSATSSVPGDTPPANGALLHPGEGYAVTAIPDRFSLFSNWVTSAGSSANPALRFIMQSNLVLTANFASNIFLPAAGTYNGLFSPDSGVSGETSGMIRGLTLKTNGVFSGTLLIAGTNYPLSGGFDLSGHAAVTIGLAATPGGRAPVPGGPMQMELTLEGAPTHQITGTVSNTLWTAHLTAERTGTNLPSAQYTLLFAPPANAPANTPPGDGYAQVTNHLGMLTVKGALADGAAFTAQTVAESQNGDFPVYATPYGNTGLLLGWINLTNLEAAPPANLLAWIKKASPLYPPYTNGFTNTLQVQGALWTNPPAKTPAIVLPEGQLVISNNAGFNLDFNVAVNTSNNLVKLAGSATNFLTGSISPKTGLLNLAFGNGNGTNATQGQGAVLQDQTNAGGFFITSTNAGAIFLRP